MIIKNRFGRIVTVDDALGKEMISRGEAEVFDQTPEPKESNPLECPYCGRLCKSQLGFNKHTEACKKKVLSSR
jgi:hypothetical protein